MRLTPLILRLVRRPRPPALSEQTWGGWPGFQDPEVERLVALAEATADEGPALAALARAPDTLPAHALLAQLRRPGPHYLTHLARLHELLRPRAYVEIGVAEGRSLALVRPGCRAVGIDPWARPTMPRVASATLVLKTSDAFFATTPGHLGFDLGFIDGDHAFPQVLRDFVNLERHAAEGAVITLHDTLPLDEATAAPTRRTTFYTSTAWKLRLVLARLRPDLMVRTIATAPTGLTVVQGLRAGPTALSKRLEAIIAVGETWTWADYLRLEDEVVPSTLTTVDELLAGRGG